MTESVAFPSDIVVDTINFCNARCPFCPLFQGKFQVDRKVQPVGVMPQRLYEKILEEVCHWERPPSDITQNAQSETLMDPEILKRLAAVKRFGLGSKMRILTNAQFLTREVAFAILDAGVDQVKIGFDGATKAVYEAHRVRCEYERVLENVRSFAALRDQARARTRIILKYVRTQANEHEVEAAYKLFGTFLSRELDRFEDSLAVDWGDRPAGDAGPYYFKKVAAGRRLAHCRFFDAQCAIHPDGTVGACCWDYNLEVSGGGFGNIAEESLLSLWRGGRRSKLGRALLAGRLPEKCRSCIIIHEIEPMPKAWKRLDERQLDLTLPSGWLYYFS